MSERQSNIVDDEPAAQPANAEAPVTLDSTLTAVVEEPVTPDTPETKEPEPDIPEKYKGKTTAEIIAMHQNAEKMIGKGSNELGELRSIVDDFIQTQSTSQSTDTPEADEEIDILDDPKGAVEKIVENHPDVVAAKELGKSTKREKALNTIKASFPVGEILSNPKFTKWIAANPYRQKQLVAANNDYDVDAATDLFSTWQELNPAPSGDSASETIKAEAANNVADAKTGDVQAQSGDSKKIYRRADIVNLMRTDRPKYEALSDEIALAYQEGRVR